MMQWIASSASIRGVRRRGSFRPGVDQHLHETLRLGALARTADARHLHLADKRGRPDSLTSRLGDAGARERRIGEQRIHGHAVRHPARSPSRRFAATIS
jgi:hypothetical protein